MWTAAYFSMFVGFSVLAGFNESEWMYLAGFICSCICSFIFGDRVADGLDRWFDSMLGSSYDNEADEAAHSGTP